jgi:hypothetical protein
MLLGCGVVIAGIIAVFLGIAKYVGMHAGRKSRCLFANVRALPL